MQPLMRNDIVLVRPARNSRTISAYMPTTHILANNPSRYIQALCTQNRSNPTLIVRYNANKVPIIRNVPISII